MKNEIELKFEIPYEAVSDTVVKFTSLGCIYQGVVFQDDFIPDFPDFLMKAQKELIRFRQVKSASETYWLITYKKKITTQEYQHYQELEADSRSNTYTTELAEVAEKLSDYPFKNSFSTITLSADIAASHVSASAAGLSALRIHSQKIRHTFAHPLGEITVDIFPKSIGSFIEIESDSRRNIDQLCAILDLPVANKISEDYGEVIKQRHADRPYPENRMALFEPTSLDEISNLISIWI